MRFVSQALAIITVAGGMGFGFAPVSAAPMPSPAAVASSVVEADASMVQHVTYDHNRGWRGDRGWRRGDNWRGNRGWRQQNRYYSQPRMRDRRITRGGNPASAGGSPRTSQ